MRIAPLPCFLLAALAASCAAIPEEERAIYAIARAGGMILEDDVVQDFGLDRTVPTVQIEGLQRAGPLGFVSGVNVQFDRGKILGESFRASMIEIPVIVGINSTPVAKTQKGVPNLFVGVGAAAYGLIVGDPIDETDWGIGPVVDMQLQVFAPEGKVFLSLGARYSLRPLHNRDLKPIDDISGTKITAGIGVRF